MIIFLAVIFCVGQISCENILFVNLVPSPSNHLWNEALIEGLLSQDHNVTMIGPFASNVKSEKYHVLQIGFESFTKIMDSTMKDLTYGSTALASILDLWTFTKACCEHSLNSQQFKTLMDYPKDFFDLIIFDITFSECYIPLIDHLGKPPTVAVTAFGMHSYINDIIGQRTENYVPYFYFPYTDKMSFFERSRNVFYLTLERVIRWYFLSELDEKNKKIFGENARKIEEIERDISLIFPNDDPILDYPRPSAPNVIPLGGVHVKSPRKLDEKLQRIMDASKDGAIFVSMDSNFRAKYYGDHAKKAFIEAFSRVNLTVLWKFENVEVPKNVIVEAWFSQRDVLAHPNVKLFITHCGGLSSQETIIRGVPVVGIPLFGDQYNRAGKFEAIKGGVILNYWELTPDNVYNSIMEVVSNPEYKQNMMSLSTLYKEQPQKPLEKFLIWIDYVLKNGHLDHLSVASRYMTWYQTDNWDIFAFATLLLMTSLMLLKKIYYDIRKMCNVNTGKEKIQ